MKHRIVLKFPGVSKETLETKLKDAIEKFKLSAEYDDGSISIIGSPSEINEIKNAYDHQKMMYDFFKNFGVKI